MRVATVERRVVRLRDEALLVVVAERERADFREREGVPVDRERFDAAPERDVFVEGRRFRVAGAPLPFLVAIVAVIACSQFLLPDARVQKMNTDRTSTDG